MRRSAEPHVGVERKTEPFKGITVDELDVRWKAVVVDLSKKGISVTNPDHALGGALSIRYVAAPYVIKTRQTTRCVQYVTLFCTLL